LHNYAEAARHLRDGRDNFSPFSQGKHLTPPQKTGRIIVRDARMLKFTTAAAAAVMISSAAAHASSDASWDKLFAKVNGTCIGQSGMDTPEATAPIVFDNATGKIAVLLRGSMGRGKAKTNVNVMCLYDKKTGKASIAEYKWLGN
jgi:hypothetical protein